MMEREIHATTSHGLDRLLERNRVWSEGMRREDRGFFENLSRGQSPEVLWIGCSDSRVPPERIVDGKPGELFVHRNVANLIVYSDLNGLSAIDYAVTALRVKHLVVCGHTGCGGLQAVLQDSRHGLVENWLRHAQEVMNRHWPLLERKKSEEERLTLLCELNVIEQLFNACQTTVVQSAWERDQPLTAHGWIYQLRDGRIRDLDVTVSHPDELPLAYERAMSRYRDK